MAGPWPPFAARVQGVTGTLRRTSLRTLQVNLGKLCNQTCKHCHVDAGPWRTEIMTPETVDQVLALAERIGAEVLDLTGGAPEMNPSFRDLVATSRAAGRHVIDRCNLTVLLEPGHEDTAEFLADHQVEVVASLPCYLGDNVDQQRGRGVFQRSLEALRRLNGLGYGAGARTLNLVYNPVGAHLPPPQRALESDYKRELLERYGIRFDRLFTITNMPIHRYADWLRRAGEFEAYMGKLVDAFNPDAVAEVMCTTLVSVGWDGTLYDCDFNQMLGMGLEDSGRPLHVADALREHLLDRPVRVDDHCYGCTAGAGSSCGGVLV